MACGLVPWKSLDSNGFQADVCGTIKCSLKPPTQTEKHLPIRETHRYINRQQILEVQKTQESVRKAATMPNLPKMVMAAGGESAASLKAPDESATLKMEVTAALNHIDQVTTAGEALTALNKGLGVIFTKHYGVEAYQRQLQPPSLCRHFFEQVHECLHT